MSAEKEWTVSFCSWPYCKCNKYVQRH